MARKPRPAIPTGTRLPTDWRSTWSGWKVWPMLYGIPQERYEAEARAFEVSVRGKVSEDWREMWKAHCRRILVERARMEPIGLGMFGTI